MADEMQAGLYEALVTEELAVRLVQLPDRLQARSRGLLAAEASDRIALYLGRVIEGAFAGVRSIRHAEDAVPSDPFAKVLVGF